jgi:hypothetical protein
MFLFSLGKNLDAHDFLNRGALTQAGNGCDIIGLHIFSVRLTS